MTILDFVREKALRVFRNMDKSSFVRLPETDDPSRWLVQVHTEDGPLPGVTGISFGLDGVPSFIVTAEQARALGEALIAVAEHLGDEA